MKSTQQKYSDFFSEAKKSMSSESISRAEEKASCILLNERLAELRNEKGLTQSQVAGFSQSGISKIEGRKDLRISTLIEYCKALGMGLEINVFSTDSTLKDRKKVLFRAG
jgi:DNA-binding XRE family transcriptional regulator